MKLALRELLRRPSRFITASVILTLIAVLLMFLGGLLDGLTRNATGALRAQNGDAIVYSDTAQASFLRSRIDPATRAAIEKIDGVSDTGGLGVVLLGTRVPGNGPRELANTAVWGYELAQARLPEPPPPGTAWADEILRADGVEVGDELLIGPARTPITVRGWVTDTAYKGQGGLWVDTPTWRKILNQNRPDAALADGVFQALVVRGGDSDPAGIVELINATRPGQVVAYTIPDAVDQIPGVTEQQATFNQILAVTVVIAFVVMALFFALLTVERTALYGVLKAIGARSGTIFAGLVIQATAVTSIAAVVAAATVTVLDLLIPPGSIPLAVSAGRIVFSAASLLAAAAAGCALSLRRILRVDPASALGSAQ